MVPIPEAVSFDELNARLEAQCWQRQTERAGRHAETIGERLVADIENRPESWLSIAYVCLFPSLIAYLCFNRGVELLGSATAGLYLNIMPVMGAFLAAIFLGESIQWFHVAGMTLIGAGIACALRKPMRSKPDPLG